MPRNINTILVQQLYDITRPGELSKSIANSTPPPTLLGSCLFSQPLKTKTMKKSINKKAEAAEDKEIARKYNRVQQVQTEAIKDFLNRPKAAR